MKRTIQPFLSEYELKDIDIKLDDTFLRCILPDLLISITNNVLAEVKDRHPSIITTTIQFSHKMIQVMFNIEVDVME